MEHPHRDDDLAVTLFSKDPSSQGAAECDSFYATSRGSWGVQGKRHGPKVMSQLTGLADDETFVEVSGPTVDVFVRRYVKERYGIDLA
jgi:hypothetical protein